MPTPRDFMARVVAWPADDEPGYVNLHYLPPQKPGEKKPGMRGRAFRSLDNFMGMAEWCARNPGLVAHTYFALATQAICGKEIHGHKLAHRNAKTALKLKAIWLDIDVGPAKGYSTVGAALAALAAFASEAQIPSPSAIVFSGGGVHAYWINDTPLTVAEWRPYAEGLKAEALKHGLKFDAGLTTDEARVLRVPGTLNCKTTPPKAVVLKHLGEDYDFAVRLDRLAAASAAAPVTATVTPPAVFDLSGFPPPAPQFAGLTDNLTTGLRDERPLDPAEVFMNCPHFFKLTARTHGAGEPQGVWMLDALACAFFEDGERWVHYLSNGYAGYERGATDELYQRKVADKERGIGWPSCKSFQDQGCKECATCPVRGQIKSPLNLALRKVAPQIAFTAPLPPLTSEWEHLPDGYTVHNDRICKIVQKKDKTTGEIVDDFAPLFKSALRDFCAMRGDEDFANQRGMVFWVRIDGNEWRRAFVPERMFQQKQELYMHLADHGVLLDPYNKQHIEHFMVSFLEKMDAAHRRMSTTPFGWFYEQGEPAGFSYGGKLFRKDGTEADSGYADPATARAYSPQGRPEPWFEAVNMITAQHRPGLESVVALSFAAPLMQVMGLPGGSYVFRSNGSGAHKTTGLKTGLAVWGSPQRCKETIGTTEKSMEHRLGTLKNLPLFLDEINNKERFPVVDKVLNTVSEGSERGRMTVDIKQREKANWQTVIGLATNEDFWAYLKTKHKNSDAIFQRVFQVELPVVQGGGSQIGTDQLISSLNFNCGHAGLVYAKFLATNYDRIHKEATAFRENFGKRVKTTDAERFRAAMVCTIIMGAKYANEALGLDFHSDEIYRFLQKQFLLARAEIQAFSIVAGSADHVERIMDKFLTEYAGGNTVWVQGVPMGPGRVTQGPPIKGPLRDDTPIFTRCEVDNRQIVFKKDVFEDFCADNDYDATATIRALKLAHGAKTMRATVAKGTRFPMGAPVTCVALPVKLDSPFAEHLYQHTSDAARPKDDTSGPSLLIPSVGLISAAVPVYGIGLTGPAAPV